MDLCLHTHLTHMTDCWLKLPLLYNLCAEAVQLETPRENTACPSERKLADCQKNILKKGRKKTCLLNTFPELHKMVDFTLSWCQT